MPEHTIGDLSRDYAKTATKSIERAKNGDRYKEGIQSPRKNKLSSAPLITPSFAIYNLTYPSTVNPSQSFQVVVDTAYTFDTTTGVYVGIWAYDVADYLTDTETTLIGLGSARFTFNLTAPASGTMNLSAALWYWDNAWVRTDYENFTVHVTTEKIAPLSATIHNIGTVNATNVTVQFFDADPDTGGIPIGSDQTISSIPRGGSKSAEVRWDTTEKVGSHIIYVRIDPNNTIAELNEDNNHAFKQIGVSGVRCSDPNVTVDQAKTSVTDDPIGEGYDLSDAPANVNILNAKGFTLTATGPDEFYLFNITFSSPVSNSFVLYKLPEWVEIPYTLLDQYTIQAQLEIRGGVLDPSFIFTTVGIFDTDPGTYPSISGIHTGTITLTKTITMSRLYTYPCLGTGGHTEYVKISNDSWSIEGLPWDDYTGDWHNISFPVTFILRANETYNYTIKTGSYPQIIHEPSYNATGGTITCTEFVDANGKRYNNWIPAIRLY